MSGLCLTADRMDPSSPRESSPVGTTRVLMLGQGWFPDQLGGLNRYYRELLLALPEATGLVLGPADDAPGRLSVVSRHDTCLPVRLWSLMRMARKIGPEAPVLDAHFALYVALPLVDRRLRDKPLLVHFQGPWADENVAAGDNSPWRRRARRRLERTVYSRAGAIVTLTGAFRRVLVEQYGIDPWRVQVITPGVDLRAFSPGSRAAARRYLGLPDDVFVACCARRLVPRMGIEVLLDAWSSCVDIRSGDRLLIAGEGEARESLQGAIAARGLERSATLLGRVTDDDLVALYRAADVNVVPSLAFEGFGLIVLEAAACGTPSIVTDAGGLPEAVSGLGGDLVVAAGASRPLAARIGRARSGELPSRHDTRTWAERHSWSIVADRHRELLARLVGDRQRSQPRRLRIVYLDHVAKLSGGELALLRLLAALTEVEPHVILAEDGPFADRLIRAGISVEVLALPGRTRELRKDRVRAGAVPLPAAADTALYVVRLAARLRRLKPDLVHTNSLKSGVYGSVAARLARVPCVWHVRDRIDGDYLSRMAVILVRAMTRFVPDVVISNSEATRRTLRRRRHSLVIGEALPRSDPDGQRPDHTTLTAVMVGRLTPWKGQDVFLRAFAQAFPSGPQRAVIIGAPLFGEEELRYTERLRTLVCELGIESRVDFRGHRDDVAGELRQATVLVHASTIPEPFGQVVIEGMRASLPVIASDGGGPAELITHGVDGLLYPPGDVARLCQLLRRLDGDPELRAHLAGGARLRAEAFSPEVIATEIMNAYRVAAAARRRRR